MYTQSDWLGSSIMGAGGGSNRAHLGRENVVCKILYLNFAGGTATVA